MSYQILLHSRALDEFGKLPKVDYERVRDAIRKLAQDPRPPGSLQLVGRDGWHLRAGNCRLVYEIDDVLQTIAIFHVGRLRSILS
ncbi:MAG: type II toxin-antitoxin system RelE family toxin [Blastocatellia bacterium]